MTQDKHLGHRARILSVPLPSQEDLLGVVGTVVDVNLDPSPLYALRLPDETVVWLADENLRWVA